MLIFIVIILFDFRGISIEVDNYVWFLNNLYTGIDPSNRNLIQSSLILFTKHGQFYIQMIFYPALKLHIPNSGS